LDDIQRKLKLIDEQLAAGPANFHKQLVNRCPLVFAAVGLIAGITIQNAFGVPSILWLILLACGALITCLSFVYLRTGRSATLTAYTALLCFLCLGGVRLNSFQHAAPNDIRNLVPDEGTPATVRGIILSQPRISNNKQWEFAELGHRDPGSSFYVQVTEAKSVEGWAKATGIVRMQVDEPVLDVKTGAYIQFYCWLDRFRKASNPGQFDMAKYLARRNVYIQASVKSRQGIELLEDNSGGLFAKLKEKLRESAMQALLVGGPFESQSRGLLNALLLGYRGNIDVVTYNAFRKTGLLHFISLSGMHLGIFVGIIWWLCKMAGFMKRGRAVICLIAVGVFLLIVPPRAPTLRAAIISGVFCLSFFFRRRPNSVNTLALAATILLLVRPTNVFEAGWQLSFAAVLGILGFTDKIENFLHKSTGSWFGSTRSGCSNLGKRLIGNLGRKAITLFSVSFAAWLGGAGILLYHFYRITPLASLWTVAVFPFVAVILTVGYLKIVLSFILPTAAA